MGMSDSGPRPMRVFTVTGRLAPCTTMRAIATIAVGSIFEADHANGIIAAGRADLCAVGRPHLANPSWTLAEAAKLGYTAVAWPKQSVPGKQQLERNLERERQLAAASNGLSPQQVAAKLLEG